MSIVVDEEEPLVDVEEPPFEPRDVKVRNECWVTDDFVVLDFLGRGKFGEVKRCREKSTEREFAAKFICAPRPQDKKDVEHEVEIMKRLQHKRLLQLYDAFANKNEMCLVLEIILGGELFDRVILDDFILSEKACMQFMRQICEGVDYMHSMNIIHLDMKPENILCLTRTGNRIKIIDFGLARDMDPTNELRVLFGTPEFMAPEVVQYDAISFATDMWSVGVICYVLLSGLSPFMGENDGETLVNITKAVYDFEYAEFEDVSDDAKDLIRKLLVKDKSKRLSAADCLEHPWLRRKKPLDRSLQLSKKRLKRFVYRRKWQKIVNAIIALKRMGVQLKTLRQRPVATSESLFGWDAKDIRKNASESPPDNTKGKKLNDVTNDITNFTNQRRGPSASPRSKKKMENDKVIIDDDLPDLSTKKTKLPDLSKTKDKKTKLPDLSKTKDRNQDNSPASAEMKDREADRLPDLSVTKHTKRDSPSNQTVTENNTSDKSEELSNVTENKKVEEPPDISPTKDKKPAKLFDLPTSKNKKTDLFTDKFQARNKFLNKFNDAAASKDSKANAVPDIPVSRFKKINKLPEWPFKKKDDKPPDVPPPRSKRKDKIHELPPCQKKKADDVVPDSSKARDKVVDSSAVKSDSGIGDEIADVDRKEDAQRGDLQQVAVSEDVEMPAASQLPSKMGKSERAVASQQQDVTEKKTTSARPPASPTKDKQAAVETLASRKEEIMDTTDTGEQRRTGDPKAADAKRILQQRIAKQAVPTEGSRGKGRKLSDANENCLPPPTQKKTRTATDHKPHHHPPKLHPVADRIGKFHEVPKSPVVAKKSGSHLRAKHTGVRRNIFEKGGIGTVSSLVRKSSLRSPGSKRREMNFTPKIPKAETDNVANPTDPTKVEASAVQASPTSATAPADISGKHIPMDISTDSQITKKSESNVVEDKTSVCDSRIGDGAPGISVDGEKSSITNVTDEGRDTIGKRKGRRGSNVEQRMREMESKAGNKISQFAQKFSKLCETPKELPTQNTPNVGTKFIPDQGTKPKSIPCAENAFDNVLNAEQISQTSLEEKTSVPEKPDVERSSTNFIENSSKENELHFPDPARNSTASETRKDVAGVEPIDVPNTSSPVLEKKKKKSWVKSKYEENSESKKQTPWGLRVSTKPNAKNGDIGGDADSPASWVENSTLNQNVKDEAGIEPMDILKTPSSMPEEKKKKSWVKSKFENKNKKQSPWGLHVQTKAATKDENTTSGARSLPCDEGELAAPQTQETGTIVEPMDIPTTPSPEQGETKKKSRVKSKYEENIKSKKHSPWGLRLSAKSPVEDDSSSGGAGSPTNDETTLKITNRDSKPGKIRPIDKFLKGKGPAWGLKPSELKASRAKNIDRDAGVVSRLSPKQDKMTDSPPCVKESQDEPVLNVTETKVPEIDRSSSRSGQQDVASTPEIDSTVRIDNTGGEEFDLSSLGTGYDVQVLDETDSIYSASKPVNEQIVVGLPGIEDKEGTSPCDGEYDPKDTSGQEQKSLDVGGNITTTEDRIPAVPATLAEPNSEVGEIIQTYELEKQYDESQMIEKKSKLSEELDIQSQNAVTAPLEIEPALKIADDIDIKTVDPTTEKTIAPLQVENFGEAGGAHVVGSDEQAMDEVKRSVLNLSLNQELINEGENIRPVHETPAPIPSVENVESTENQNTMVPDSEGAAETSILAVAVDEIVHEARTESDDSNPIIQATSISNVDETYLADVTAVSKTEDVTPLNNEITSELLCESVCLTAHPSDQTNEHSLSTFDTVSEMAPIESEQNISQPDLPNQDILEEAKSQVTIGQVDVGQQVEEGNDEDSNKSWAAKRTSKLNSMFKKTKEKLFGTRQSPSRQSPERKVKTSRFSWGRSSSKKDEAKSKEDIPICDSPEPILEEGLDKIRVVPLPQSDTNTTAEDIYSSMENETGHSDLKRQTSVVELSLSQSQPTTPESPPVAVQQPQCEVITQTIDMTPVTPPVDQSFVPVDDSLKTSSAKVILRTDTPPSPIIVQHTANLPAEPVGSPVEKTADGAAGRIPRRGPLQRNSASSISNKPYGSMRGLSIKKRAVDVDNIVIPIQVVLRQKTKVEPEEDAKNQVQKQDTVVSSASVPLDVPKHDPNVNIRSNQSATARNVPGMGPIPGLPVAPKVHKVKVVHVDAFDTKPSRTYYPACTDYDSKIMHSNEGGPPNFDDSDAFNQWNSMFSATDPTSHWLTQSSTDNDPFNFERFTSKKPVFNFMSSAAPKTKVSSFNMMIRQPFEEAEPESDSASISYNPLGADSSSNLDLSSVVTPDNDIESISVSIPPPRSKDTLQGRLAAHKNQFAAFRDRFSNPSNHPS